MSLCKQRAVNERREQPSESRERILAAAVSVFALKGFQRASLDEIAAEAHLTKGAIYWHFRSKNDLFTSLLEYRFQQHTAPLAEELALALAAPTIQARQQAIATMLRDMLNRFHDNAAWPRLYLEFVSQTRDAQIASSMAQLYDHGRLLAKQMIERLVEAGITDPDLDADTVSIFWCALIDGFMLAWVMKPETFADGQLVERTVAMLWNGLAPKQV
ncbi:TetR/AcrR family transcriptional regulator [Perlucidibaca aquatica]|uniref:TetR/AcrR family transcriptional regulator n=1 Tax=Perlucidibaca aquatica TaxID=1852776 RepID=UPI00083B876B|nr:TetR/AcrR family transcriptional regulator [Perlucidibaca aquatica]